MLRFAVLKGIQGFGDRLQCLLQAIRYAQHTERILVVDWRDTDWTHDHQQFGFAEFFRVTGVHCFGVEEFCQYVQAHGKELRVMPQTWTHKLTDWKFQNWVYSEIFSHPPDDPEDTFNQCISQIIAYKRPDFDADVVVLPGVYRRVCHYGDMRFLKLSRWAEARIRYLLEPHDALRLRGYDAIHLRGGSKSWAGGHVPLKGLAKQIEDTWPDEEGFFERMHTAYTNLIASHPPRPLLLVSDSKQLMDGWQQRFGECLTVPTFNSVLEESGTHKLTPRQLQEHKVNKSELNLELMRDFVLLTNARSITWDGISLFSKAAVGAKQSGVSLMWLPQVESASTMSDARAAERQSGNDPGDDSSDNEEPKAAEPT